ncbi:MAG: hypothetical protein WCB52_18980 [Pseudolabrys sp.]
MLPILRILPVGGVLLAILILVLALSPPDGSRTPLNSAIVPARGALLDRDRHPETRQFLILAAIKRADELNRLRELPDTPVRSDKAQPKIAGLPSDRNDTDPDETGTINGTPGVSIPVEIGEPSSTELPVAAPEGSAAATNSKPQRESRRRVHRVRAARPTTRPGQPQQFNFFEMLFGGQQYQKPGYGPQRYQQPGYNAQQAGQQYHQPAYGYGPQQYQQYQQYQPYASPEASQQSAFSQVPRTTPY